MKIQDQVYGAIQAKLARLCASEYRSHAAKHKNRKKLPPLTYGAEVKRLLELSSEVLGATSDEAEGIMVEVTSGAIDYAVLKGGAV